MGWFWSAPTPPRPSPSAHPSPAAPGQGSQQAQTAAPPPPAPSSPPPTADDDTTDREVAKFLEEFAAEFRGTSKPAGTGTGTTAAAATTAPSNPPQPPAQPPSSSSTRSWFSSNNSPSSSNPEPQTRAAAAPPRPPEHQQQHQQAQEARLSPLAESLLPTTMSCTQAFDLAYHCQSFGGQFTNVYRYGGVRRCSEHWDDFWFCMRVKGYTGRAKEDAVRAHYRDKELRKYGPGRPSSEDVWEERAERLAPGAAFSEAAAPPDVADAEYQRAEMERIKRIRDGL